MTRLRGAYAGSAFKRFCRNCGKRVFEETEACTEAVRLTRGNPAHPQEAYRRDECDGWHVGGATRDPRRLSA